MRLGGQGGISGSGDDVWLEGVAEAVPLQCNPLVHSEKLFCLKVNKRFSKLVANI